LEAEVGMLVVETNAKIRRALFKQGKPIKAICRELGVSRKVVRKVIRSGATDFATSGKISLCRRLAAGETASISFCLRTRQSRYVNV
jgi:hypothetical protein